MILVNFSGEGWDRFGDYSGPVETLPLSPVVVADPPAANSARRRHRATAATLSTRSTPSRSAKEVEPARTWPYPSGPDDLEVGWRFGKQSPP